MEVELQRGGNWHDEIGEGVEVGAPVQDEPRRPTLRIIDGPDHLKGPGEMTSDQIECRLAHFASKDVDDEMPDAHLRGKSICGLGRLAWFEGDEGPVI